MTACDACLTRAELLGRLGPAIQRLIQRPSERARRLLALTNTDLVRAVVPHAADEVVAAIDRYDPERMRTRARAAGLAVLCKHCEAYPPLLREASDAPHALFVRHGARSLAELSAEPCVAIVGTRTASAYAVETAHEVARALSVAGVTVVSGLARGVDGAAHRGALAGGGRTIAVLGCGADVPYPASHRRLYSRVAEAAAIVSELPPGTPARPWAFPARNRIMAGLASFVLVVEAAERSGTLITAEFALDMGRELGAVPGRVNHRMAAGSNRLLKDGATVVRDPEDILDAVCGVGVRPARARVTADLDPAARAVLDAIEAGDSPRAAGALEARHLRVALGRLEALGLVRRDGLGGYERTGAR